MKKYLKLLANKYVITAFAFFIWVMFFDQNDWFSLQERQRDLDTLNGNITFLNAEIDEMNKQRDELVNNPVAIEKFAREHYHLKKENEDVYVIDDNNGK